MPRLYNSSSVRSSCHTSTGKCFDSTVSDSFYGFRREPADSFSPLSKPILGSNTESANTLKDMQSPASLDFDTVHTDKTFITRQDHPQVVYFYC